MPTISMFLVLFMKILVSGSTRLLPEFLNDIATKHNAAGINVYINSLQPDLASHLRQLNKQDWLVNIVHQSKTGFFLNNKETLICLFLVDPWNQTGSMEAFQRHFDSTTNRKNVIWLLDVTSFFTLKEVKAHLEKTSLDFDDDLFLLNQTSEDRISALEVYRISSSMPLTVLDYGYWSRATGVEVYLNSEKWVRRQNLQGFQFRTQSLAFKPAISALVPLGEGFYEGQGPLFDLFNVLKEALNFTYILRKPPDGNWGLQKADGSWNGMFEQLITDQTDIAISDLLETFDRSLVVSFAASIMEGYYGLLIKNVAGKLNWLAYFEPLDYLAWFAILLFCALVPPFLWISSRYPKREDDYEEFTLSKSYIFLLSFLTQRGWSVEPSSGSARMAFISLVIGSFLLYQHWEAMLISYLSTRIVNLPFQNYEELLSKSTYKVYITPGTAVDNFFQSSNRPLFQEVYRTRIEPFINDHPTFREAFQSLQTDDGVAVVDFFPAALTRKEYLECQVLIIPYSKILQSKASFAFQKNSPYEPIFSYYLNEMRESGSLKKVVNIVTGSPQCPHQSGTPIGFDSCLAAFLALFLGLSSGLILICFERVYQRVEGSQQSIMKRSCSNFSGLVALIDKVIYKQQFESLYAVRNRALHLERQLCELSHRNHFLEERLNRCLMKHK